jgi:TPR repeat protein
LDTFNVGDIILAKYEVVRVLGKGGMGVVLAARHLELDELVALKFPHPSVRDKPELSARFAREARTGIRIKNEHVARILDVGTVDGVPFIVMEYLDGHDLAVMLVARGPLPVAEAVDLLLQACEGVNEAHMLGIVHRDLKPANLFLTAAADGAPFVKVLDFGISKSSFKKEIATTAGAAVLGSPVYMPPEQYASARDVDARCDVWSLGAVLYEMLAGQAAFTGGDVTEVYAAVLRGTYAALSDQRPDIPALLEQSVSAALRTNRDLRFQSVEAFAARLAPFGTDAARDSYARIQRRAAARTSVPPNASARASAPLTTLGSGGTGAPRVTVAAGTLGEVTLPPRRRAWASRAALGALGAGVAVAAVLGVVRRVGVHATDGATVGSAASASPNAGPCADGATAACETACAAHEPGRCNELAVALEKGVGAAKDPARAATLYDAECEGGMPAACNSLGALYARGEGVARNDAKAVMLYTRACDAGHARACVNLGAMHFDGDGVPKDESLGANFFLRGCVAGEPIGCANVSVAYAQGRGVPKDATQAFTYAERACKGGAVVGCVRVDVARVAGEGTTKDVKAGLEDLDARCTKGEPAGCDKLTALYVTGVGTDVPVDSLRVREYAKKACDLGSQSGCRTSKLLGAADSSNSTAAQAKTLLRTR